MDEIVIDIQTIFELHYKKDRLILFIHFNILGLFTSVIHLLSFVLHLMLLYHWLILFLPLKAVPHLNTQLPTLRFTSFVPKTSILPQLGL